LAFSGTAAAATSFAAAGARPRPFVHFVPTPALPGTIGSVTAVDGTSTAGTCGTAGGDGTAAVSPWKSSVATVDVTPSTTFIEPGVSTPSFANLCVGDVVGAVGSVSNDIVTASKVYVFPPKTPPVPHGTFGTVTTVNDTTVAGTCGTAAATGTFTVAAWRSSVTTVDVTSSTTFNEPGQSDPSFADVCVGEAVGAIGSVTGDTVTATKVYVFPPRPTPVPESTFGTVTTVNGTTASGTCGTAPSAGTFVVATWGNGVRIVDVTPTTTFMEFGMSGPSFADVCVGTLVGASGTGADASADLTATKVFIVVPPTTPTPSPMVGTMSSTHQPAASGPSQPTPGHEAGHGIPVTGHSWTTPPTAPNAYGNGDNNGWHGGSGGDSPTGDPAHVGTNDTGSWSGGFHGGH
jgi:hypothetical protein